MPSEFLTFLLYLFYGMAFFAIGVSITSRDMRSSNLNIAKAFWIFALFAYSHAFHEWFELYQNLPLPSSACLDQNFVPIYILKLLLVLVSFTFLLWFGIRALKLSFPKQRRILTFLPLPLFAILFFTVAPFLNDFCLTSYTFINARIRNFIGLPGALFSGIGLLFYARTLISISKKGARNFTGAGYALIVYGILTGVVPSGSHLPIMELPIELFRGLSAFGVLHFVMHALYIFDEERRLLIEERLTRFAKSEKLNALGRLSFGIAHEINNPLTNVSLNVELLKSDLADTLISDKTQKRFLTIERNLDRASKIARELLAFSTEKEPAFIPTSINEIIESSLELLGSRRHAYQISVAYGDVGSILAIPWKLEEVFINILVNAMDATPEGGAISIATRQHDGMIFVDIIDAGSGIPDEQIQQVLDPFFTTKEVGKGTGLGLSICYGIMDLHGGAIELFSRVGQGTKVLLSFPEEGVND